MNRSLSNKSETSRDFLIAVDIDGVLAEQTLPTLARANKEYGLKLQLEDVVSRNIKVGPTTLVALIERNLLDPKWVMAMPVIRGAKMGLKQLRKWGFVIVVSTTPKETQKYREKWIAKNFGFEPLFINTWNTGKADIPVDVLIDDSVKNINDFTSKNRRHYGVLFTRPSNKDAELNRQTIRASDWPHATQAVFRILEKYFSPNPKYTGWRL